MIGIASYLVSSPRSMMVLLIVSAVAVVSVQFSPALFESNAPGAGAERVSVTDSIIDNPVYASLFEVPRSVPQDSARVATEPPTESDGGEIRGVSAPSEPVSSEQDEFVAEIVVNVPQVAPSSFDEPSTQPVEEQLVLRPTFSWVNVFSDGSTVNGEPVQVGDVITAFDPEGTLVGRFTVVKEGRFGLMALYEDDPTTTVDEGAVPGDEISFEINGIPAVVLGPQAPVWTSNGAIMLSNLAAVS